MSDLKISDSFRKSISVEPAEPRGQGDLWAKGAKLRGPGDQVAKLLGLIEEKIYMS